MKLVAGMLVAGALLLAAGSAAADEERPLFSLMVGHPLPTPVGVEGHEQPACLTHQLVWDGTWRTAVEPLNAYGHGDLSGGFAQFQGRAGNLTDLLGDRLILTAASGLAQVPWWASHPFDGPLWALGLVSGEDACLVTMLEPHPDLPAI